MQAVGTKNTGPELTVRRLLHALGYRFRLHQRHLSGTPDIVLSKFRTAIFVHGCFWHGHSCAKGRLPKSRLDYWGPKIAATRARDTASRAKLEALGWQVLVIWQCETKDAESLGRIIRDALPQKSIDSGILID
jgi:DNA mismatch endonuclease (patch repair protein)